MRVLVVEDNVKLLESIVTLLSEEYTVDSTEAGDEALYMAQQNIYDAIVLDVMLPEMDGFEVLKSLREEQISTPVLFLTAKDSLEDRVNGLNLGGDDYLVKPFQNQELKARLRAILRRSSHLTVNQTLCYKGIMIDDRKKLVKIDGEIIVFSLKQYELLEYLVQNKNRILTREQIYDRIWGFESDTTMGIVEVYIHQIRKKLQPFSYDQDLKTIRGIGYMLADS